MKTILLLSNLLVSFASSADLSPLLGKYSGGGFIAPDYARAESCEVFSDHVVITKSYGHGENGLQTKQVLNVMVSANMQNVMAKAMSEKVEEKPNRICDLPSSSIRFNAGGHEDLLYSTGGCGSPHKERKGPYSKMLTDLISSYCPNSY